MRICVVSEVSAVEKNRSVIAALEGRGHQVINAGMRSASDPELTYINTGFMAALLLNAGRADLVVGGCGTGQGFLASCAQYPGVFAGILVDSLDAWLFRQINAGNCVSLPLNKGYGWAAEVNLRFLFDHFFAAEEGCGYPPSRRESQRASLARLRSLSSLTHRSFPDIIRCADDAVVRPALSFPGMDEILQLQDLADAELRAAIASRMGR